MSNPSLSQSDAPLTPRLAAHLLRRTTYNFNIDRIIAFTELTPHDAVEQLFNYSTPTKYTNGPIDWNHNVPIHEEANLNHNSQSNFSNGQRGRATILWSIYDALYDTTSRWKVMHWLHTIFTVRTNAQFFHYWKLLETCIETDMKTIAIKVTTDSCMMSYLDNDTNTKDNFNENFAREVLELMTIRKGPSLGLGNYTHYTEVDIANAAKALSGFTLDDPTWNPQTNSPLNSPFNDVINTGIASAKPDPYLHDFNVKVFSPELVGDGSENTIQSYPFDYDVIGDSQQIEDGQKRMYEELDEFYSIVYGNSETARSIVRRMYMFFVRDEISDTTESTIIEPLAQDLKNSGYDHILVLKKLLKSNHFYDLADTDSIDNVVGGKIKSPWELLYQSINLFGIPELPDGSVADRKFLFETSFFIVGDEHLRYIGLNPRGPDTVEGYPGFYDGPKFSKNWFSSSNLYRRYTLAESFKGNYQYAHPTNSIFTQAFPFIVDLFSFVEQFEMLDGAGQPDPGTGPPSFSPKGVANATHLVTQIVGALLPETAWYLDDDNDDNDSWSQDRYDYFLDSLLGGLSPVNWYFSWVEYLAVKDDPNDPNYNETVKNVQIGLERLFDAILSSPEFQTF